MPQPIDLNSGRPISESDLRRSFGASEYTKDGLLAITEKFEAEPWYDRLIEVLDQIWAHAPVTSDFGPLPSDGSEANGELLQVMARLYHRTHDPRYLEWGRRLADAYCREVLPGNGGLPAKSWDFESHAPIIPGFRLRDHDNEIVGGLVEWLVAESVAPDSRVSQYGPTVEQLLLTLLEKGRDEEGNWLLEMHPDHVVPVPDRLKDTPNDNWGYLYSAYVTYAWSLPPGEPLRERFLDEARRALHKVTELRSARWESGHYDGYADALESALYMLAVFDDPEAERWVHDEIGVLFAYQQPDGFVDKTYLDGNFVRTALLYGLWTSAGVVPTPWTNGIRVGAVRRPEGLLLSVSCDAAWGGSLLFDTPRHRGHFNLPMNYPRLNAWPEWFTVDADSRYEIRNMDSDSRQVVSGSLLRNGLPMAVGRGETVRLVIRALS
jgi:hypothetical protein